MAPAGTILLPAAREKASAFPGLAAPGRSRRCSVVAAVLAFVVGYFGLCPWYSCVSPWFSLQLMVGAGSTPREWQGGWKSGIGRFCRRENVSRDGCWLGCSLLRRYFLRTS